jgi:glycosyltransferase involved in cell wall biosynthesis
MTYSIIVPVYNAEKYLHRCIDSILAQSDSDYELILVDDGSQDSSGEICDTYAAADNRIKVFHQKNKGVVSARNKGIAMTQGDYICYVDADDRVESRMLEKLREYLKKYHEPDMLFFQAIRDYGDQQKEIPNYLAQGYYDKNRLMKEVYPAMMYMPDQPFCTGMVYTVPWGKLYKRKLLSSHFCRDERIRQGDDAAFVYECVYYADSVAVVSDVFYYYNCINENSIMSRYDCNYLHNVKILSKYLSNRLGNKNASLDAQINAKKANWTIVAVTQEVRHKQKWSDSVSHFRQELEGDDYLTSIQTAGLPFVIRLYLFLLRKHCYRLTLLASWVNVKLRAIRDPLCTH